MATTAVTTTSPATAEINQSVRTTTVITNGDLVSHTVESFIPYVRTTGETDPTTYNSAVALGTVQFPSGNMTIPPAGTLAVSFEVTPFAPSITTSQPAGTFDVLALIRMTDGTTLESTADTLTVNPLPDTQPE